MKEDQKRTSPLGWIIVVLVLVILLMYVNCPLVIRSKKNSEYVRAAMNARSIGIALLEFEQSFGTFPDETTASGIQKKSNKPTHFRFDSSNDYFSQLLSAEVISDDSIFYAKTTYTKKPRNNNTSLDPGDVGYGYLLNGKNGFTSAGNPSRVILCSPLLHDGTSVSSRLFDPDVHDGMSILLRIDGSVPSPRIDPTTKSVILGGGKSLLDTGPDTIWGSDVIPLIIPPLPAP